MVLLVVSLLIIVEGSRSRTGKAMVPKSGLLSVVVNAVTEGSVSKRLILKKHFHLRYVFPVFDWFSLKKPKMIFGAHRLVAIFSYWTQLFLRKH